MLEFRDDDIGYLAWTAAHPDGFVLNVRGAPDTNYIVLHRASCKSISNSNQEPGAFTGRAYRKIVSTSLADLHRGAQREGRSDGSFSKHCGRCQPLR
jgi:hypothetical protein